MSNLFTPEEQYSVRKKALRLLEHMDRTEEGLRKKLYHYGFSQEAVQDAVKYVKSFGYINDTRYARNYIASRMGNKSKQKIMQELFQKGVSRQTVEEAWLEETEYGEPDEKAAIKKEVEKKFQEGTSLDEKEMRRLYGFLARRGFHQNDIFSVLDEMNITCRYKYERDYDVDD